MKKRINFFNSIYIKKNYKILSNQEIATALGISKDEVASFLKINELKRTKEDSENINLNFSSKNPCKEKAIFFKKSKKQQVEKLTVYGLLLLILIFAYSFRSNTFYLSHVRGDQHHYLGLAMKLDLFGMKGYNLRGINFGFSNHPKWKNAILSVIPAKDKDKGDILKSLEKNGTFYYDEPLHHIAPGFAYLLRFSHYLFANKEVYSAVQVHLGEKVLFEKPKYFKDAQFYAVFVPLFFSLLLVLTVFFLGKLLFSDWIGLISAFMIAVNPVDIMTSQKIWADDPLAFFVAASILLYLTAKKKDLWWLSIGAGLFCGYSVLLKQSGGFIVFGLILYHFWERRKDFANPKRWKYIFWNHHLFLFGLGMLFMVTPWFVKVYTTYGDPIYRPVQENLQVIEKSGWFKMLSRRSWYMYPLGIPFIEPIFLLFYAGVVDVFLSKEKRTEKVLLVIWVL
ncbi:MAG: glycosyltransferase family 39 protein, partial [Candidatus Theseobacter exili]|nr:glycosyltransferase family 39 protein [Candidatus Theseobacter exili]